MKSIIFNSLRLVVLCLLSLGYTQCSSSQKVMQVSKTIVLNSQDVPQAYYQHWMAGVQGGGSGINLFIAKELLPDVPFRQAYFQGKISDALVEGDRLVARFKGDANQQKDYIMHSDPEQEYGNTIHHKKDDLETSFPFELKEDEAILSYVNSKDVLQYLKITGLVKKEMLAYPSAPNGNIPKEVEE